MFDRARLDWLIDLHARSYALLHWAAEQSRRGALPLGRVHGPLSAPEAALEWVERNWASLPAGARPDRADVEPFAHLFASYLLTSFTVVPKRLRRVSSCGCDCGFCSYLVAASVLALRDPSARDRAVAEQVKLDCLEALALEAGAPLLRTELASLARGPSRRDLALVTYLRELDRRTSYRGQGQPVLALWRELAWSEGRPRRGFALEAAEVLAAEERLRALLARAGAA